MSRNVQPIEVLSYLNELGYTNLDKQQLKEFMKDLKKLLKYDKVQQQSVQSSQTNGNNCEICDENEANIFNMLYKQSTISSKAKEKEAPLVAEKRDKQITVVIKKPLSQTNRGEEAQKVKILNKESQVSVETQGTTSKNTRPASSQSVVDKNDVTTKKKTRSAKPVVKINKSDPVALYHYYKSQWQKANIPGEVNRAGIRWSVRERMKSAPPAVRSASTIRSGCNSIR